MYYLNADIIDHSSINDLRSSIFRSSILPPSTLSYRTSPEYERFRRGKVDGGTERILKLI